MGSGRSVPAPRRSHRRGRGKARRDRHHRNAVRCRSRTRRSSAQNCVGFFDWLKERNVTAVITGERGDGTAHPSRHRGIRLGLRHRPRPPRQEQTSTRRLRILKYRGSLHGTNEYPFLIEESGVSVLPISRRPWLQHQVSNERVSTGVDSPRRHARRRGLLQGEHRAGQRHGGYREVDVAAQFCDATCRRGERAMYFAFEESEAEIVRNMSSIGLDLRAMGGQRAVAVPVLPPGPARPGGAPVRHAEAGHRASILRS